MTDQVDGYRPAIVIKRAASNRRSSLEGEDPAADLPSELTDNEGTLLALVLREQPITAYQIAKIYEESPVTNFNTSKGKIYPLIRRLRARGLMSADAVEGDARGTERLFCTASGKAAVKSWVKENRSSHLLLEDALRTKVQSFDLLTREEQLAWLVETRDMLSDKLKEVEAYGQSVEVPFHALVHDSAVSSLRARIDWLDRALSVIAKRKP